MKIDLKRPPNLGLVLLLLLSISLQSFSQTNATVTGTVRDNDGGLLANVTVVAINESDSALQISAITNELGVFRFQLNAGTSYRFRLSYVGFQTQEIRNYTAKAGENTAVTVTMNTSTSAALEEVIVVGFGTQKRLNATGAVDQISSKNLESRPISNLTQGLQGLLPNLNIKMADGKPTQSPSYNIRGTTSIGQGGSALVLIDGFEPKLVESK